MTDTTWFPWQRAATLAERVPGAPTGEAPGGAHPRYAFWTEHSWLRDHPGADADRARAAGVDAGTFRALLSEPDAAVAVRRPDIPEWARRFVQATDTDADDGPLTGFGILLRPLVDTALADLGARIDALGALPACLAPLRATLLAQLPRQRLSEALLRTLTLELNVARVTDRLTGDTPQERYADFCDSLADPETARAIWTEYPVLARYIGTLLDRWVANQARLATRLVADLPALVDAGLLPADPGALTAVSGSAGDVHRGGQSVALVTFEHATVVYKPRSFAVDRAFGALLRWFNQHGPAHPLRVPRLLERAAYGWSEFVAAEPCGDTAAVTAFYHRTGTLLALLYLLDATDFHYENVIAAGDQPVLIDLEALLHGAFSEVTPSQPDPVDDPAQRLLDRSVTRIGLLPTAMLVQDEDQRRQKVDVSGIGAQAEQVAWATMDLPQDIGTDQQRLTRQRPTMNLRLDNQPTLAGEPVDPAEHGAAVLDGFTTTYRMLLAHQHEPGLARTLAGFRDVRLRAILRPTHAYAHLLGDTLHPDFLRDARDRHICLDRLWNGLPHTPHRGALIESEIAQLVDGDVPLFECVADERALVGADGTRVPDVLDTSPYAALRQRLAALSEVDLGTQTELIRGAYATMTMDGAGWPRFDRPVRETGADRDAVLAAVRGLTDRILDSAVREGDTIGWVTAALHDDHLWTLQRAGHDLYSGRAGIGLYLACAGALTGDRRALSAATLTADGIVAEIDTLLAKADEVAAEDLASTAALGALTGGFSGFGGALYFLDTLRRLTGSDRWVAPMPRIAAALERFARYDSYHDMIGGVPGAILSLFAVRDVLGPAAVDLAVRCAEHMLAAASRTPDGRYLWASPLGVDRGMLTGLSHGAAGIALAFATLHAHAPDPRYAAVVRSALQHERAHWNPEHANWLDLREVGIRTPGAVTALDWCHGAPGIGLARLALLRLPERCADPDLLERMDLPGGTAALRADLRAALDITAATRFGDRLTGARTHSLCHGDIGTLSVVEDCATYTGDRALLAQCDRVRGTVLDIAADTGWSCGLPAGTPAPGLLCGLSGIGFGLLRAVYGSRVPNVLLLEPLPD